MIFILGMIYLFIEISNQINFITIFFIQKQILRIYSIFINFVEFRVLFYDTKYTPWYFL